jgi:hypothetical protein
MVALITSCGGSEGSGDASPVTTSTATLDSGALSDPTTPTTGSPATVMAAAASAAPTSPPTISIDVSDTGDPQTSTPPTAPPPMSFPLPEPLAPEYQGSGRIIESYGQPHLALGVNSSYPPSVFFGLPLAGWDWALVDDELTDGHTTWTDTLYSVVGAWDGTTLTLTRPPGAATDDGQGQLPDGLEPPTPGCELADAQSAVASDGAAAAGLAMVGPPIASSGDCYVFAVAVIDNPALRAVLAPVADRVRLEYVLEQAG